MKKKEEDTRIPCTNPEHAGKGSKYCADCAAVAEKSLKTYEKQKKQKIEKIRKYFFERAGEKQQTEMATAIYEYVNEYGSCDFLKEGEIEK